MTSAFNLVGRFIFSYIGKSLCAHLKRIISAGIALYLMCDLCHCSLSYVAESTSWRRYVCIKMKFIDMMSFFFITVICAYSS